MISAAAQTHTAEGRRGAARGGGQGRGARRPWRGAARLGDASEAVGSVKELERQLQMDGQPSSPR